MPLSILTTDDPCPSPRRKTPLLRSNSAQGPIGSLDSEMAKAMKVFFRDVKTVQKKLDIIKANGNYLLNRVGQTDGRTDGWTDGQTDRQTDRQTCVCV